MNGFFGGKHQGKDDLDDLGHGWLKMDPLLDQRSDQWIWVLFLLTSNIIKLCFVNWEYVKNLQSSSTIFGMNSKISAILRFIKVPGF